MKSCTLISILIIPLDQNQCFYSSPSGLAMPFMPGPIEEKFQADDFDSLSEGIALHDETY